MLVNIPYMDLMGNGNNSQVIGGLDFGRTFDLFTTKVRSFSVLLLRDHCIHVLAKYVQYICYVKACVNLIFQVKLLCCCKLLHPI